MKEFDEHVQILRHLRTDGYIDTKMNQTTAEEFDITFCSTSYLKEKAWRTIEKQFDINICSGAINSDDGPIDLGESIFKLVRTNYKQKRPTSKQALILHHSHQMLRCFRHR